MEYLSLLIILVIFIILLIFGIVISRKYIFTTLSIYSRKSSKLTEKEEAVADEKDVISEGVQDEDEVDELYIRLEVLMKNKDVFTDRNLRRKDIADILNTNERYLYESLQKNTGLSFNDYITRKRLEYAKVLISQPNPKQTLEAVATLSGIGDRSSLYRLFKKYEGMSPVEYKEQIKSEKNLIN